VGGERKEEEKKSLTTNHPTVDDTRRTE